ncbi:hypothetical protein M8756_16645 [Lutimaribacter sp. EGI FJ00015]|uniref:Uncharacterized protein n=1 Tax=Lutimaribacter degradans TaxID=2945989 RepID=A0ACC6A005_9RHOB|nr:hypothetical protein [Lutimaribacter sp. EGI FJ00013]MCM2563755.1 hypothetical protein [Lutimaribacter sp. EGI FJ00013]MCO0614941.1 hypothetical protein [Lutimaribacter sp. EGI FJ00015]MCO0637579.1 hypothetical protein [Lutimaribacter sp. EGI FJ00014]
MPSAIMPPGQTSPNGSYLDWPAILAGGVFALAISFLLISFGASLGLSLSSPYRGEGMSAFWFAIAAGIWFAWVMVTSFGAGGYLAGRMRRHAGDATEDEVETRDGAHGLIVWATGALVSIILAASGVGGLVSAGASAVGSAASTAVNVASEAASSDYFANVMLRSGAQDAGAGATDTDVASGNDGDPAMTPGSQSARQTTEIAGVDPDVQQEIAGILMRSAANGEVVERDRRYLALLVAANSDLDQNAARTRVDEVVAEIDGARNAALAAVEKVRVAGVVFGFIVAATLLVGAVAAFFAAVAGGHHRDEGLGLDVLTVRR